MIRDSYHIKSGFSLESHFMCRTSSSLVTSVVSKTQPGPLSECMQFTFSVTGSNECTDFTTIPRLTTMCGLMSCPQHKPANNLHNAKSTPNCQLCNPTTYHRINPYNHRIYHVIPQND